MAKQHHHINQNDSFISIIEYFKKDNESLKDENIALRKEIEELKKEREEFSESTEVLRKSVINLFDNLESIFIKLSVPQIVITNIRKLKKDLING